MTNTAPRLLIASTNRAKLDEYRLLLAELPLTLVSLADVGVEAAPRESGSTFAENALVKARFYRRMTGLATLADDGGLEVDALGGEPGVRSHRWLDGSEADDQALIAEVLRRMEGVRDERRTARLKVALALAYSVDGREREAVVEAALEGIIAQNAHPSYKLGFPYRAVLFLPERGCYYAELDEREAAAISHRKAAVERARPYLTDIVRTERPPQAD
jgi:XTP/dITP diphosphohydrolase